MSYDKNSSPAHAGGKTRQTRKPHDFNDSMYRVSPILDESVSPADRFAHAIGSHPAGGDRS